MDYQGNTASAIARDTIHTETNQLTIQHFNRWLEGQLNFGVALHIDTPFYERYLAQHPTQTPDERLQRFIRRLPREITAARLKEAIDTTQI